MNNIKILQIFIPLMLPLNHNKIWSDNEVRILHREYEIFDMTIKDIAESHQRTIFSILHKLQKEGIIERWEDATGWKSCINDFQKYVNSDYQNELMEITNYETSNDFYNMEINNIHLTIIHIFYFLASAIDYIYGFFQKKILLQ